MRSWSLSPPYVRRVAKDAAGAAVRAFYHAVFKQRGEKGLLYTEKGRGGRGGLCGLSQPT